MPEFQEDDPVILLDRDGNAVISLQAGNADVKIGGFGKDGDITMFPKEGTDHHPRRATIHLDAQSGDIRIGGHGKNGEIRVFPTTASDIQEDSQATIRLNGEAGDIELTNADAAEDFEITGPDALEPGDVVVFGDDGSQGVRRSRTPYDSRVAGVVAGAGECRPGIVLGRQQSGRSCVPVALIGRVWVKVDAQPGPIQSGDLLTTSDRAGHAMRASRRDLAFGAVLGKAMGSLESGTGLLPILVALQ